MQFEVNKCDSAFDSRCEGKTKIPYTRTKWDEETGGGLNSPREQINEKTSWIDGSFLYSTSEPWVAALRSWNRGMFTENDDIAGYPPLNSRIIPLINPAPPHIHKLLNPERLFSLGDPRINEHIGILTIGIVLFRWHNFQANKIANEHTYWSDEEIFQAARRVVIASLQNNPDIFIKLEKIYEDINTLDAYVGGMLETTDAGMGELFKLIILDQFLRLRDGDRFWFENEQNDIFNKTEVEEIRKLRLSDILRAVSDINPSEIQDNVFKFHPNDPCPQPFQVNATGLERCIPMMRYDYFSGNEVTYIFSIITLGAIIPLLCVAVARYLIIRRRKNGVSLIEMPKIIKKEPEQTNRVSNCSSDSNSLSNSSVSRLYVDADIVNGKFKMPAIEWLSDNFCRSVNFQLDLSTGDILIKKPRSKTILRKLNIAKSSQVSLTTTDPNSKSSYGPFMLISIPKNYDLVIRLHDDKDCRKFMKCIEDCLKKFDTPLIVQFRQNDALLESAETKEKRQRKLDKFFREAYSRSFEDPKLSDKNVDYDESLSHSTLGIKISKAEFADALGMKVDNHFVERLFACLTTKNEDVVDFDEFLQFIKKFAHGSQKDKMSILFKMCDSNGDGKVDREEFITFIRQIMEPAGVKMEYHVRLLN
uniref:NAD(P)H oxidase (H2O2-forming) n=1 Tax=Rhabditophanes sp. KR3021 TaxID=114890 RepID=A0AC35U9J2_9BILA